MLKKKDRIIWMLKKRWNMTKKYSSLITFYIISSFQILLPLILIKIKKIKNNYRIIQGALQCLKI
jgi:hypothetical protein